MHIVIGVTKCPEIKTFADTLSARSPTKRFVPVKPGYARFANWQQSGRLSRASWIYGGGPAFARYCVHVLCKAKYRLRALRMAGHTMAGWSGHRAGTHSALLELLTTAQSGRMKFSEAQRALFTACEFWAAFQNASLSEYLSADTEAYLRAAEAAFGAVGLPTIAAILTSARLRIADNSPVSTRQLAQEIEKALSAVNEPVDLALERFANHIEDV
jgi:hypothetical protein